MRARKNLREGDIIIICRKNYELIKSFSGPRGGGFQFRTWLVKDLGISGRRERSKEYVIKATTKPRLVTSELKFYVYLAKRNFPDRYYSELLAFDNNAISYRRGKRIGKFYVILLKRYDGSLESLRNKLTLDEKEKVLRKLRKRVERLHNLGVIHGDLREANVLLRIKKKGIGVLLTDFANSKFLRDLRSPESRRLIEEENRKLDRMFSRLLRC